LISLLVPDASRLDPATLDIARNIGVYLHPFFRHLDTLNGVRPTKRSKTLPALAISAGRTSAAPAPSSCPSWTAILHLEQQADACNAPVIMNLVCTHLTTICVRRALIAVGTILPWGLPPSFLLVSTLKALAKFKCIRIARASCDAAALSRLEEIDRDICTNLPPHF
jgi:hypothetical protein